VLDPNLLADDPNNLLRFQREARAAAALSHPNIVRTIDLDSNGDWHYLIMEYVQGMTLHNWLAQNPNAPQRLLAGFILHAANGLHHICNAGLIHRDLKPSNLLIDTQGIVKILDLGLAKFTADTSDGLTRIPNRPTGTRRWTSVRTSTAWG
jgi:eukaryotic-like serine/threonine-protein kinase